MIAIILTLIVGLFILMGIYLGNKLKSNKKFIDISIGLAFGVMSLLLLCDVIPEAYELLYEQMKMKGIFLLVICTIIGFFILKLLDHFVPHHQHEALHHHNHYNDKCHNEHLEHVGILASVAIVIHNIIEGMTLFITANNDLKAGLLLCLAISLHNIPLGIVISSTSHKKTTISNIVLGLSTFIGGVIILLVSNIMTDLFVGILLCLTMGMLIYITLVELWPQIFFNSKKKDSLIGIALGMLIIVISMLLG